jgi:hypothetical protein
MAQNAVHHCLEGHRRVRETERHDKEFKQSLVCTKGRFVDVAGGHPNL